MASGSEPASNLDVDSASRFWRIDGHRIRYAEFRSDSSKRPLLICNGLGMSLETLLPFVEKYHKRTIIIFDAVGVGLSSAPLLPKRIQDHARYTDRLMDKLGYEEADVMGISWGGMLAQQLAHDNEQRYKHLVLTVTCAGGLTLIPGSPVAMLELGFPLRKFSQSYRDKILPTLYGGITRSEVHHAVEHSNRNVMGSMWGYFAQLMSGGAWTSLHWLHKLQQPTLVLSGKDDPLIPEINQRILARQIPNARIHHVDCGHLLFITQLDEVTDLMDEFFSDHEIECH